MTTSINVKTRGLGATVEVDGQQTHLGPNQEQRFNTDSSTTIKVTQDEGEEARVPGSEQNDELIKEVPTETLDKLSGKSNKTGATETSATTETK